SRSSASRARPSGPRGRGARTSRRSWRRCRPRRPRRSRPISATPTPARRPSAPPPTRGSDRGSEPRPPACAAMWRRGCARAPRLRAVVGAQAAALGGAAAPDGDATPDELRADVARAYEGQRSRSGIDQLAILAAVLAPVTREARPQAGLMLAGSLYDDELGGH